MYICICVYTYIYIYVSICIYVFLCIYLSIYPSNYLSIYLPTTYTNICMYKIQCPKFNGSPKKDEKINAPKAFTMEFKTPKKLGNTNSMGEKRIQNDRTNH